MAFKDLLNKGMDMISKGAQAAKTAAVDKKNAIHAFDLLKTKSDHIGPMNVYAAQNTDPQVGKEQMILNVCLTINVENAKVVNSLIPVDETIIDVKTGREAKTEIEYAFVITDKRLWILNKNEYITYDFGAPKNFEIVNKGLMSQGVMFDDKAFILDGSEADIQKFIDTMTKNDFRMQVVTRKAQYLCGVTPVSQILNMNMRGVTFAENNMVVLHNNTDNKLVSINDIQMVQILINDTVVLSRGRIDSGSIISSPMEARKISVKFLLNMGDYTIDVLPQNMMNSTYKREDITYINNYDFSKKIVEAIVNAMKSN